MRFVDEVKPRLVPSHLRLQLLEPVRLQNRGAGVSIPLRSQLLRIEHEPSLNHPPDALCVLDVLQRIGIEQYDVGELADLQCAEVVTGTYGLGRRLRGEA